MDEISDGKKAWRFALYWVFFFGGGGFELMHIYHRKTKKNTNECFNFMCIIYIICSKEKDLVQTLSCLSMIITPAFAEVSTDSSLTRYLKKYSNFKCYKY